jgi:predicted lipoprotein with Yx(FWY)xxD motif
MNRSHETRKGDSPRPRRPSRLGLGTAATALALAATLTAIALAAGGAPTVGSASSPKLAERIAVNSHGRTLYALSPETAHRLLCKSSACFAVWPPLTVRSTKVKLKAGPGVDGALGILRRSNGMLQVTLRGLPLYTYAGDSASGQVNGEDLHSFGGVWHAMSASAGTSGTHGTPSTSASTAPTYPKEEPRKEEAW